MAKLCYFLGVALVCVFVYAEDDFICSPGTNYLENDCNTCFCSPLRTLACGMKRWYESRFTLYNCNPGDTYFDECNQCWCIDGFGTVCTNRKCA